MSTTVDSRVVEMRFDNKHFENNVQTSLGTIDKLKQSLNLTGATKGLENVSSAAKKVDLSGISSAAETVGLKFNAMYTMADQALRNITNSAVNYGKKIVSALTIDPIKTGFSEYETQINAVQTILANTKSKGTTLDDVNGALDELNTYADKTIYNFTEMTRNIGTFTAAGVDLDKSVSSIKGIANLAAVSGSSSQQASTAMYQLSQALAAGKVSLMDWNSVVNAGMGGQLFQDALKRTAENMGTNVDALIKKYGSFRESLTKGEWLTADVLTETLSQLAGAYTETDLLAKGYTKEQAREILELADTAEQAATKVKTFTQLWDTLKESAQSGWTQTWEILVGDFEEAKKLLTSVSEIIGGMLEDSAKERNDLLQGWKDAGGREDLIASLFNIFEAGLSIMTQVKDAFREIFPAMTVDRLVGLTEGLKAFTKSLKPGTKTLTNIKNTFKGLFAILSIVKQAFSAIFSAIKPLFGGFGELGGGILEATGSLGEWLVNLDKTIKETNVFGEAIEWVKNAFKKIGEFLKPVVDGVKEFGSTLSETFTDVADKAKVRFEPLVILGEILKGIFVGIGNIIKKVAPWIASAASGIGNVFKGLMESISSSIQNTDYNSLFDFANGGIITAIGVFIAKFIKSGGDILDNAGGFLENLNGILEGVGESLNAFTESIKSKTLLNIAIAIGILAAALVTISLIDSDKLTSSMTAITVLFSELMGSMTLFSKMVDGNGLKGLGKISTAMIALSAALLILSIALKILSTMTWEEMGIGLISMTVGLGVLVGAVNLLPSEAKLGSASKAIKKLATAMLILSLAIKILSTMTWEEMGIGLIAMTAGLGVLVGAIHLLPKDTALKTAGLVGLATAMVILGGALKIMATMSWEEIGKSLASLAGSLAAIVIAMRLMPRDLALKAVGMLALSAALVVLGGALKIMATMSWEEIGKGLVTLGGSLIIIAAAMALMKSALPGAAALVVVSAALAILTPVLLALGSMSWEEIGKGLITLAGAFAIIGVAGLVLKPLVPTILALSAAIMLFGVGCAAVGAGALALGAGLTAIAAAGSAAAGSIVVIVSGIVGLIPYMIEQIGVGIIKLCEVIAGSSAAICEAFSVIVLALVDALVTSVPAIVEGVFVLVDALLGSLVDHTPTIVTALFDFLIGILEAIAQKLPELIKAGVDLVMSFFTGVLNALQTIDTSTLVQSILAVGVLTALMAALAAVAAMTPAAMTGVLGLGAFVTELAIVLAAVGALAQIPGLEWLISEGGQFLQSIGTAIGQFLGGIVGGVAQGMTAALPQIGTDLANFMTNIQPFIEGAKAIDPSTMDGVQSLVGVILALTAANVLEGLTSWFTGGSSLTKFGEEIAAFAPCIKTYADTISGIDATAVEASANAAKALAEMTSYIPNEGGVVAWFTGENSIAKFGTELVTLGMGLRSYSLAITGFNAEAVIASANAAKALAEMTACIPNEGGVAAWFTGENSIAKFGAELVALGMGLRSYSLAITGFDAEAVIASANAAKALAEMTSYIPNEGGITAWFTGENSVLKFSSELVHLGHGLWAYSEAIKGIDTEAVMASANAAKSLAELTSYIPNEGGVVAWFTGETSISKFSTDLVSLGTGLKGFSDAVAGVNIENATAAATVAQTIAGIASTIPNEGGVVSWFTGENSLSKFSTDIVSLGIGLKGFSDAVAGVIVENAAGAVGVAKAIASMTSQIPNEGGVVSWFTGEQSISKFGGELTALGEGLKGFSDNVEGINPDNVTAAATAAQALAQMASYVPNEGGMQAWFTGDNSVASFGSKLPALGEGLKGFSDAVDGISPDNVTAAADAARDLAGMASSTPENTDRLVKFGENLVTFGEKLKSYIDDTSGISTDSIKATSSALESISSSTDKLDAGKMTTASEAIDTLLDSIKNMSSVTEKSVEGFISSLKKLGETSVDALLTAFKNAHPDLENAGKTAMDKFIDGVNAKVDAAKAKFSDLVSACAEVTANAISKFRTAGGDLVRGFAAGISSNTYLAKAKARAMAAAAANAAKEELDEHSPSRVGYGIGDFFGVAFVNGIADNVKQAYGVGSDIASSAKDGLSQAIGKIRDFIDSDMDVQPTIRPVLDLSDVRAGAGSIGNLLNIGSSVGVLSNVGAISSTMNRNSQNGKNGEVVGAINKLRKDLGNVGNNTYNINGVTYDDGSNVSDAVKVIVRAARVERRK